MRALSVTEVFGDPADFAIEAGGEPDLQAPSAVWGHMWVWCRGVALANLDDRHCALYTAYKSFEWMSGQLDDLRDPELEVLDATAAWNFLDGLLYGYHGDVELTDDRTEAQCLADSRRWGRHDFLTNWGEQFDGWKAFVFALPGDLIRILYRRSREPVQYADVSRASFATAAEGFS